MSAERSSIGIISDPAAIRANHWVNAFSIFVPWLGFATGIALLGSWTPTATTLLVFGVFFLFNVVGLIAGLHRYFTHRAFETGRLFRLFLAVGGSFSMQGPIDRWVADHRRHHRFCDGPFDVHSPYWSNDQPISSPLLRFAHAHILWMFTGRPTRTTMYAKDILADPITRFCSRYYWPLCASSLLLPALVGGVVAGPQEALRSFVWAGCLRVSLIQQFAWSVNSFGHMVGSRPNLDKDEARDNRVLAYIVFGEGLHGYHHAHPRTAVNQPAALDTTGRLIGLLEKAGIVWKVERS